MNVHVRSSFSLFLSILRSPLLHCPHHHWATVEVVSGRGMMPNLTGVEPYLYSLHSRFCFKGFVYTRPINHLLPSHNPAAFKLGARLRDIVWHRCQCKSLFLLQFGTEIRVRQTTVTIFPSGLYSFYFTYSDLGKSIQHGPKFTFFVVYDPDRHNPWIVRYF